MKLKDDAIFKEKLIGGLKNGIRNLVNFHPSSQQSEAYQAYLHFDGLVLSKAYQVLDEKEQKSYVSPECFLNFLSKFYIPPCVGKTFRFMEFTFLENALI